MTSAACKGWAGMALLLAAAAAPCGPMMAAAPPAAPREVMDVDVDRVIGELKRYLYALQLPGGGWPNPGHPSRSVSYSVPGGGSTALALFALLEAGEGPKSAAMKSGLDVLAKMQTENLYIIAFRVMCFSQAFTQDRESPYREVLKKDLEWLTRKGGPVSAAQAGAWGYRGPEGLGDNSCSQIALLALWEADLAGLEVDQDVLRKVEQTWVKRQRKDGGWTYPGVPDANGVSTASMTSAALASLFICRDVLSLADGAYSHQRNLDQGWAFLEKNLKSDYIRNGYLAFCVQRVGMTTGRKFIGEMDWFAEGAAILCAPDPQGRRYQGGTYGPLVEAAFELVFLSRGRLPLTFNKLQYGQERDWNFHNRDVPRFTEYMRRNFENRMRWQVVEANENVQLLLDAPIVLVEGQAAPDLSPEQWAKLREYTLRGGTLLFLPNHNSRPFIEAVKKNLGELYAEQAKTAGGTLYKLEALDEGHSLYGVFGEKIPRGDKTFPLWGVSDGTRELALLCEKDIAASWQRRNRVTGKLDYQLGTNVFLYATGFNPMRTKMRPVFLGSSKQVNTRVKVAWLQHGGNWFTQPYALGYLSEKLTAENRVAIESETGVPIDAKGLQGYHLAWMTGSEAFTLSDAQVADLRAYLDGGGTLFVNAVGGSRAFRRSAEDLFDKLFAGQNVVRGEPAPDSPLLTGKIADFRGPIIDPAALARTRVWQQTDTAAKGLQLRTYEKNGRIQVLYGPYGIHDTLDGHTAYAALSYMPGSAMDIAANVVLYAYVHGTDAKRAPRPASEPAAKAD